MICIISGTNRDDSRSLKLARLLERIYGDLGQETTLLDLRELPAELFAPAAYVEKPEAFKKNFIAPVLASAGLHVVTPEYNGSFSGILKYFIDMLPFPDSFDSRPVAFVGISNGVYGGLRPIEQLQMVFGYRNAYVFPQRVFIPGASAALTAEGHLADPELEKRLRRQAEGFARFATRLSAAD